MSTNNQYYQLQDHVYKRYMKTCMYSIGGNRSNPLDNNSQTLVGWMLGTDPKDFNFEIKQPKAFTYENEVLEVYSEAEDKIFRRMNRAFFSAGLLVEFEGKEPVFDTSNELTDLEILAMVKIPQIGVFKKRLDDITSKVTLERVLTQLKEANKSYRFIQAVEERLA